MGEQWKRWQTLLVWTPKSLQMLTAAMKLKDACSLEESYDKPRQYIKKQRHYFTNKGPSCQSYGFSSSYVWMWELDYKESWELKHWCFWTVVLEKTLESPLDCKEIQPVHSKGDQSWIVIERTDAEAETLILWALDSKNWLIWKDPDAGKDWRHNLQSEGGDRGGDGWMASLTQWTWVWVGSGSWGWTGRLACYSPWGRKESDTTEWLNWTEGVQCIDLIHVYITKWLPL